MNRLFFGLNFYQVYTNHGRKIKKSMEKMKSHFKLCRQMAFLDPSPQRLPSGFH